MGDEFTNLVLAFKALGPLVGNALKSGQLCKARCELDSVESTEWHPENVRKLREGR